MGTWLELRCENRDNRSAKATNPSAPGIRCHSHDNSGPMELAADSLQSVTAAWRALQTSARESGWVKTKYGWICPYCAQQPDARKELAEFEASLHSTSST